MTDYTKITETFNWEKHLFEESAAINKENLENYLKAQSHLFENKVVKNYEEIKKKYENWYATEGMKLLTDLTKKLWIDLWSRGEDAMPAHDARHALYKVPSRAIQHYIAEQCEGIDSLGLIGALLHDWGRWAEEKIYHGPQASMVHSRLSYTLIKSFITRRYKDQIPEDILNLLYESVIKHTSGANSSDNMPLKLVVRSDRDQLYGPEFILRIVHHIPGHENHVNSFYGLKHSVFATINRPATTRLQGPLYALDQELRVLENFSEKFLLQVARPEDFELIKTYPEYTYNLKKQKEIEYKEAALHFDARHPASFNEIIDRLLNSKYIAKKPVFVQDTYAKFKDIPADMLPYVKGALNMTIFMQEELDSLQKTFLEQQKNNKDSVIAALSQLLLSQPDTTY